MEPLGIELAERVRLPDAVLRAAIRTRVRRRIRLESRGGVEAQSERLRAQIADSDRGQIAVATDAANLQHYEVLAEFFALCLGPRRKYSCALWTDGVHDLAAAEEAMRRAEADMADPTRRQASLEANLQRAVVRLRVAEYRKRKSHVSQSDRH